MLGRLVAHGIPATSAALTVFGVRLATAGVSIALGLVFVLLHFRSARAVSATHFDDIADAYDVQIPESRRHALLETKTELMRVAIETRGGGRRGLDVGCGQGAYVGRMRTLGFDVSGIDASAADAPARLRRYAQLYGNVLGADRMCLCGMLAAEVATLPVAMQGEVRRFFDTNERWLAAVVADGHRDGTVRAGDAVGAARMLLAAFEGAALIARSYGDPARFGASVDQVLGGLVS